MTHPKATMKSNKREYVVGMIRMEQLISGKFMPFFHFAKGTSWPDKSFTLFTKSEALHCLGEAETAYRLVPVVKPKRRSGK